MIMAKIKQKLQSTASSIAQCRVIFLTKSHLRKRIVTLCAATLFLALAARLGQIADNFFQSPCRGICAKYFEFVFHELSIGIWVEGCLTTTSHSKSHMSVYLLEKIRDSHVMWTCYTVHIFVISGNNHDTQFCLSPNLTRSQEELKALVKTATKAHQNGHTHTLISR